LQRKRVWKEYALHAERHQGFIGTIVILAEMLACGKQDEGKRAVKRIGEAREAVWQYSARCRPLGRGLGNAEAGVEGAAWRHTSCGILL
jgi:hypothetical protein